MKEVAEGWDWKDIRGISYRQAGHIHHNLERRTLTNKELDQLPFVTQIYAVSYTHLTLPTKRIV